MEHKNYIKTKCYIDGKFSDGTFTDVKDHLSRVWNPEMYIVTLPDGKEVFGDDFIENFYDTCKEYEIEVDTPSE